MMDAKILQNAIMTKKLGIIRNSITKENIFSIVCHAKE